jgi:DNA-binding response OmpR family regulator
MNRLSDQAKGIMVVDEDPGRRRLITLFLKRAGYVALSVRGPQEALEALELLTPDLFVICADLDEMYGLELCHRIRVTPSAAKSPLLMLVMRQDSRFISYEGSVDAVMTIPFVGYELVNMVQNLLSKS